jgi:hypothetical protein
MIRAGDQAYPGQDREGWSQESLGHDREKESCQFYSGQKKGRWSQESLGHDQSWRFKHILARTDRDGVRRVLAMIESRSHASSSQKREGWPALTRVGMDGVRTVLARKR